MYASKEFTAKLHVKPADTGSSTGLITKVLEEVTVVIPPVVVIANVVKYVTQFVEEVTLRVFL